MKSATLEDREAGLYSVCPIRVTRSVAGLSPVGRRSSPITALTRVDLPAPRLPKKPITGFFLRFASSRSVSSNASRNPSDGRKSGFTAATFDLRAAILLNPSESRSEILFFFPRGIELHHPCPQVSSVGHFHRYKKEKQLLPSTLCQKNRQSYPPLTILFYPLSKANERIYLKSR